MPTRNPLSIPGGWSRENTSVTEGDTQSQAEAESVPRSAAGVVSDSGEILDESGNAIGKISDSKNIKDLAGNTVTATGDVVSTSGDVLGKATLGTEYTTSHPNIPSDTSSQSGGWNLLGKTKSTVQTASNLSQHVNTGLQFAGNLQQSSQRQQQQGDTEAEAAGSTRTLKGEGDKAATGAHASQPEISGDAKDTVASSAPAENAPGIELKDNDETAEIKAGEDASGAAAATEKQPEKAAAKGIKTAEPDVIGSAGDRTNEPLTVKSPVPIDEEGEKVTKGEAVPETTSQLGSDDKSSALPSGKAAEPNLSEKKLDELTEKAGQHAPLEKNIEKPTEKATEQAPSEVDVGKVTDRAAEAAPTEQAADAASKKAPSEPNLNKATDDGSKHDLSEKNLAQLTSETAEQAPSDQGLGQAMEPPAEIPEDIGEETATDKPAELAPSQGDVNQLADIGTGQAPSGRVPTEKDADQGTEKGTGHAPSEKDGDQRTETNFERRTDRGTERAPSQPDQDQRTEKGTEPAPSERPTEQQAPEDLVETKSQIPAGTEAGSVAGKIAAKAEGEVEGQVPAEGEEVLKEGEEALKEGEKLDDAKTEQAEGAEAKLEGAEGAEKEEGEAEAEEEKELIDYTVLKGTKVNKAGNLVDKSGDIMGRLIEGDAKQLLGMTCDKEGNIWNDSGKIVGRGEPLPEGDRAGAKDFAPFENFPDATVEADGRVMSGGRQVGTVVEGDPKRLKGSRVDEDGDILDRRGNVVGRAEAWDEPEPLPEEEEVPIDRSILAGKRVNKAGNVVDSAGVIYGRVVEGNVANLKGRMCNKDGNVMSESGEIIGRAELVPEHEREGSRDGAFADLVGCTVAKDGKVVTASGNVVGRLIQGDSKTLLGRSVDEDGDVVDRNGNVLGKAERWEEPEVEKRKDPLAGKRVNREGNVIDEDGNLIGKLVTGEILICSGKEIDEDGDVVNSKGNTIGHVCLLEDIPPTPEPEPEPEPEVEVEEESAEAKEVREQAEKDRKLAGQLSYAIEQSLDQIRPICKMITDKIDAAERQPKEERDEEQLVKDVKPLIEDGHRILTEVNGVVRGADPDGRIQRQAKHRAGTRDASPEEYHLAEVLKELTGTVTQTIDNAKRKIEGMPHAKKELNPLWGLLSEPLFQILAAVGLLLNGVLGLVGRLLNIVGLGGIIDNLLGGLGIGKLLGSLGLGDALDSLTGKKQKK
ncbi:hypothetical protein HIM_02456 [Hirsutella minnesotensis 3608]|nr:hypothetical protein HIM_02456 [Hirsutella minnesotensis 3608]